MKWILKIILFTIGILWSIRTSFMSLLLNIGMTLLYLLMIFYIIGEIERL